MFESFLSGKNEFCGVEWNEYPQVLPAKEKRKSVSKALGLSIPIIYNF